MNFLKFKLNFSYLVFISNITVIFVLKYYNNIT